MKPAYEVVTDPLIHYDVIKEMTLGRESAAR
jgi:hypothetical protein